MSARAAKPNVAKPVLDRLKLLVANDGDSGQLWSRMLLASALGFNAPGRNIAKECGYPETSELNCSKFMDLYLRNGIAARVNDVFPDECWAVYPRIFQNKSNKETPFERAWRALDDEVSACSYLHRVDRISGIGRYGVLLLGFNDLSQKDDLSKPVKGLDENGRPIKGASGVKLEYLRTFSEDAARISTVETDQRSPRCGQPLLYQLNFSVPAGGSDLQSQSWSVHWTRVIHLAADNKLNSIVFGVPRMQQVLNYLLDLIKVGGGSAEMFWKGAFPGYSFETLPELAGEVTVDEDSIREQFFAYANGLKRYLSLDGMTAKPLWPQTADPTAHAAHNLMMIAATIGIPLRLFLGSEAGKDSSLTDLGNHNKRTARRQKLELTPWLIRPFFNRLISVGALPNPGADGYGAEWDDLNSLSDKDRAGIALQRSQALMQYVSSGAYKLIRPVSYLVRFAGYAKEEAEAMIAEAGGESAIMTALDAVVIPPKPAPGAKPQGGGRKGNAPRRKPGRPGGSAV